MDTAEAGHGELGGLLQEIVIDHAGYPVDGIGKLPETHADLVGLEREILAPRYAVIHVEEELGLGRDYGLEPFVEGLDLMGLLRQIVDQLFVDREVADGQLGDKVLVDIGQLGG